VPGDLDAAPVTDLAVHECLADRLADPVEDRPPARLDGSDPDNDQHGR
jgi:hypothetical protein